MNAYFKGVESEKVIYPRLADLAATGHTIYIIINVAYLPEEIRNKYDKFTEYEIINAISMNMCIEFDVGKGEETYFKFNINLPHVLVQVSSNGDLLFYDSANKDSLGNVICVLSTLSNELREGNKENE